MKTWENSIKERRKKARLTLAELSERTNISPTSLSRYERGEQYPRPATIANIARALDCSVADLRDPSSAQEEGLIEKIMYILNTKKSDLDWMAEKYGGQFESEFQKGLSCGIGYALETLEIETGRRIAHL